MSPMSLEAFIDLGQEKRRGKPFVVVRSSIKQRRRENWNKGKI